MTAPVSNPDRLFELLPAVHRIADAENGGQLQALLALINRQADDVGADVRQLWDDFFVETSQRWVVPYIGDLVGNIPLIDPDVRAAAATAESLFADLFGPDLAVRSPVRTRADVARTIHYRRRKGTPAMLEELAGDVTGWGAKVVEFFQLLDWNQHLEHLRLECAGCPDLRSVERDDRIGQRGTRRPAPSTSEPSANGKAGTGSATSGSSCGGFWPCPTRRWCRARSAARRGSSPSARSATTCRCSPRATARRRARDARPS